MARFGSNAWCPALLSWLQPCMDKPPETEITWPVMNPASSDDFSAASAGIRFSRESSPRLSFALSANAPSPATNPSARVCCTSRCASTLAAYRSNAAIAPAEGSSARADHATQPKATAIHKSMRGTTEIDCFMYATLPEPAHQRNLLRLTSTAHIPHRINLQPSMPYDITSSDTDLSFQAPRRYTEPQ